LIIQSRIEEDAMSDERREAGLDILERLFGGEPAASEVSAPMMALSTLHLFGEVWARPGLSLRDRELITVSVIAALGRERQLRLHLRGALNAGLSREELIETFMHLAYYAGYPAGFTALAIAKEVFDAEDAEASATG
jgi:4-carboxymuconolactone decarboxylase